MKFTFPIVFLIPALVAVSQVAATPQPTPKPDIPFLNLQKFDGGSLSSSLASEASVRSSSLSGAAASLSGSLSSGAVSRSSSFASVTLNNPTVSTTSIGASGCNNQMVIGTSSFCCPGYYINNKCYASTASDSAHIKTPTISGSSSSPSTGHDGNDNNDDSDAGVPGHSVTYAAVTAAMLGAVAGAFL